MTIFSNLQITASLVVVTLYGSVRRFKDLGEDNNIDQGMFSDRLKPGRR
jgi:hypothetical protein